MRDYNPTHNIQICHFIGQSQKEICFILNAAQFFPLAWDIDLMDSCIDIMKTNRYIDLPRNVFLTQKGMF